MVHGFNKALELAKQLTNQGFLLSFNEAIFRKSHFDFHQLTLTNIFLETDTQTGVLIEDIYELASGHFNVELDNLKDKIYRNFTDIFLGNGR
jgi:Tat protein secretion system quality control protein TatD with DNase activity